MKWVCKHTLSLKLLCQGFHCTTKSTLKKTSLNWDKLGERKWRWWDMKRKRLYSAISPSWIHFNKLRITFFKVCHSIHSLLLLVLDAYLFFYFYVFYFWFFLWFKINVCAPSSFVTTHTNRNWKRGTDR